MPSRTVLLFVWGFLLLVLAGACAGDSSPEPTATPRPLPAPLELAQEPTGATRGDPSFEPLPDAQASFGELGGSVYQIEMPDDWNGRLVLYIHGFANFSPTLTVQQPGIRDYLIERGYAWGASSFSNNSLIPGTAADETAALWDLFVTEFGRPDFTYITGQSMGGGGVQLAAERYPNRFDGALSLCGITGNSPEIAYLGDFFAAAAYATGQTQADFDAMGAGLLTENRILPDLEDPNALDQLVELATNISGGPRPFARQGVLEQMSGNLQFVGVAIGGGLYDNNDTVFATGTDFDDAFIRVTGGELAELFYDNQEATGELQLPLLTLQTTADLFVPLSGQQLLRRLVDEAGTSELLVQRTVQASGHCTMLNQEWIHSLEELILWVESGERPDGEDLLGDLTDAGREFTLAPRIGSPDADDAPGADERLTLTGRMTLDGQPFQGALLGVVVERDGLQSSCSFAGFSRVSGGGYSATIASNKEVSGCGSPGDELQLFARARGGFMTSQTMAVWPDGSELTFDAAFSSADADGVSLPTTTFLGELTDASGEPRPPGTLVEAFIGETLCGATSMPHVVMGPSNPFVYFLIVSGPQLVPGCLAGAQITFQVDGEEIEQTATNGLELMPREIDLSLS